MKTIALLILISLTSIVNAQTVYRTQNLNVGFGKVSNCSTNKYMDFCINGPLVASNQKPVGGYIDNGIQKQDWVEPSIAGGNFAVGNGIFGLGFDGNLYMVSYSEAYRLPAMKWAFQNGPMLVQNGRNVRGTSASKYVRSGVGYRSDKTLIVIETDQPVTFREFAEMFVQEGCLNAIYLDGDDLYVGHADNSGSYGMVAEATKLQFFNN